MARKATSDVAPKFGANLRAAREQAGLAQEALAERAETHRTEIGLLERGERVPKIDTLLRVAGALDIEPCDLLAGMAWTPPVNAPRPRGGYELDDGS